MFGRYVFRLVYIFFGDFVLFEISDLVGEGFNLRDPIIVFGS